MLLNGSGNADNLLKGITSSLLGVVLCFAECGDAIISNLNPTTIPRVLIARP
jgi:hypothetical protein